MVRRMDVRETFISPALLFSIVNILIYLINVLKNLIAFDLVCCSVEYKFLLTSTDIPLKTTRCFSNPSMHFSYSRVNTVFISTSWLSSLFRSLGSIKVCVSVCVCAYTFHIFDFSGKHMEVFLPSGCSMSLYVMEINVMLNESSSSIFLFCKLISSNNCLLFCICDLEIDALPCVDSCFCSPQV